MLYYLSGLTCSDENARTKAAAIYEKHREVAKEKLRNEVTNGMTAKEVVAAVDDPRPRTATGRSKSAWDDDSEAAPSVDDGSTSKNWRRRTSLVA